MKHLTDTCERLRRDARGRALVMQEILKHTLQEKFSIDDSAGVDLAGLMHPRTKGFDMRPILALPEFTEPLSLKEEGVVDPCTHLISRFMLVQDGDSEDSDVAMGPFFDIGHVTRLFSKATQTNSARSGRNENVSSPAQGGDAPPPEEPAHHEEGAGNPAPAADGGGDSEEQEQSAPEKKKKRKGDPDTEQGRKKRKGKKKREPKQKKLASPRQGKSCNPF